jgi:hypothetical protein
MEVISICSARIVDHREVNKLVEAETVGHAFHKTTARMLRPTKHKKAPRTRLENLVMIIRLILSQPTILSVRKHVLYFMKQKSKLHFSS